VPEKTRAAENLRVPYKCRATEKPRAAESGLDVDSVSEN